MVVISKIIASVSWKWGRGKDRKRRRKGKVPAGVSGKKEAKGRLTALSERSIRLTGREKRGFIFAPSNTED